MALQAMRALARNIARGLAANEEIWGEDTPHIYLDGIKGLSDDGNPVAVVVARSSEGLAGHGDTTYSIEVLVGVNASARPGNMATSEEDAEPYLEFGDGDRLGEVVERIINYLRGASMGAVLRDCSVDFDFASLPMQFATIRLAYYEISTFGD